MQQHLSTVLASNFWADLECRHPCIDSLRLSVEISTAWKARLASKTIRKGFCWIKAQWEVCGVRSPLRQPAPPM